MKNKMLRVFFAAAVAAALVVFPVGNRSASAEETYYIVQDTEGRVLFMHGDQVYIDDEYISGDNKRYRVVEVDDQARRGVAQYVEDLTMSLGTKVVPMAANASEKTVCIYTSHNDECFVPTEGTDNNPEGGGIQDVAESLRKNLEKMNVKSVYDSTLHVPHDQGAYTRSRRTAARLMKEEQPTMLLDVHRDGGVPPSEYETQINGEDCSKVRVVIGRSNQNRYANEEVAKKIKQVADEKYPGLFKDIYIGKGSYNQDLMANAILLEIGTDKISKERALRSTGMLAEVITTVIGGGELPGATPKPNPSASPKVNNAVPPAPGTSPQFSSRAQKTPSPPVRGRASSGRLAWWWPWVSCSSLWPIRPTNARRSLLGSSVK